MAVPLIRKALTRFGLVRERFDPIRINPIYPHRLEAQEVSFRETPKGKTTAHDPYRRQRKNSYFASVALTVACTVTGAALGYRMHQVNWTALRAAIQGQASTASSPVSLAIVQPPAVTEAAVPRKLPVDYPIPTPLNIAPGEYPMPFGKPTTPVPSKTALSSAEEPIDVELPIRKLVDKHLATAKDDAVVLPERSLR